jgi:hypothetical protein
MKSPDIPGRFRWAVVGVLAVHGLIHLLGMAKGFGWAEVPALREPIGRGAGALWLLAAVLVLAAAAMLALRGPSWWWVVALAAAAISQAAIVSGWGDAKAGTAVNLLLLLVAGFGFASLGPTSFEAQWRARAADALAAASAPSGVVTEEQVEALPAPVARYVRLSGAMGRPHVRNFYAEVHGRIRGGPDEAWMPFTGHQLNTYGLQPRRFFIIHATKSGLPITVFHVFDEHATMRGRLLDLIPVVDARGPEMDRSETVTLLNDLVLLAPAMLVDAPIEWTEITDTIVDATYTRGDQTVTARLIFNESGDLLDFVSDDRMRASSDGQSFTPQRWDTPVNQYATFRGVRLFSGGSGMWSAPPPEGHFAYIEFTIDDLAYNVTSPGLRAGTPSRPIKPHQPHTDRQLGSPFEDRCVGRDRVGRHDVPSLPLGSESCEACERAADHVLLSRQSVRLVVRDLDVDADGSSCAVRQWRQLPLEA